MHRGDKILIEFLLSNFPVVKQRLQMYNSPYRNIMSCILHVYKTEGIIAFYRSYTTQLIMNVPLQSIHFIAYELSQSFTNPQHEYNPLAHVVSGELMIFSPLFAKQNLNVCLYNYISNFRFF